GRTAARSSVHPDTSDKRFQATITRLLKRLTAAIEAGESPCAGPSPRLDALLDKLRELPSEAHEPFAQRVKAEAFDRFLHANPRIAQEIACFLRDRLGGGLANPSIVALGMLASADVTRQMGHAAEA